MEHHSVVVVGAGPAGLATTVELARRGVDVLLVERRSTTSPLPRATVLSLRSMELLRSWGLQERVESVSDAVEMTMRTMPSAARAADGTTVDVGYPSLAQSAVLSPARPLCVAQDLLEEVLLEHVRSLPHVEVEPGLSLLDLAPRGTGSLLTVSTASGEVRRLSADYVVGCDGARSAVRTALGIPLVGPGVLFDGARIEFRAPLWNVLGPHRHLLYAATDPGSTGVLLPAGRGDRWLFGVTHGRDGDVEAPLSSFSLLARMLRATDLHDADIRAARFDRFTAGAQVAASFSSGSVFLAGDAAHRVTPRGGTGLNIALADGHDIGWKLGWVLRGWASPALLDTYEAERRPAVQHNVHRSADPAGSRRPTSHEIQVDVGGRVKHAWVAPGVSTLDLLGEGLTFLGAGPVDTCASPHRPGPPVRSVGLDPLTARSLGLGSGGAALLRPDGVPAATWSTPPPPPFVARAAEAVAAGHTTSDSPPTSRQGRPMTVHAAAATS